MKSTEELKKYRNMEEKDLIAEVKKVRKDLFLTSLKVKAGKADDSANITKLKKNIARINSVILEKQYGVNNGK